MCVNIIDNRICLISYMIWLLVIGFVIVTIKFRESIQNVVLVWEL